MTETKWVVVKYEGKRKPVRINEAILGKINFDFKYIVLNKKEYNWETWWEGVKEEDNLTYGFSKNRKSIGKVKDMEDITEYIVKEKMNELKQDIKRAVKELKRIKDYMKEQNV